MPKVYQAYYSDGKERRWKTNNASRTLILVEARNAAKKYGVKVDVDILEIEKPSLLELSKTRLSPARATKSLTPSLSKSAVEKTVAPIPSNIRGKRLFSEKPCGEFQYIKLIIGPSG